MGALVSNREHCICQNVEILWGVVANVNEGIRNIILYISNKEAQRVRMEVIFDSCHDSMFLIDFRVFQ